MLKTNAFFISLLVCVLVLTSSAFATPTDTVLDFTGLTTTNLGTYQPGVTFNGWIASNGAIRQSVWGVAASITFAENVYVTSFLGSFGTLQAGQKTSMSYYLDGDLVGSVKFNDILDNNNYKSFVYALGQEIDQLVFTVARSATNTNLVKIDNLSYHATPLPGAAVFFVSGLLGLVGIQRRKLL